MLSRARVSFLTPNELFYVRNHLPVPLVEPQDYVLKVIDRRAARLVTACRRDAALQIETGDGESHALTLQQLKTDFPKTSVVAAIQVHCWRLSLVAVALVAARCAADARRRPATRALSAPAIGGRT